MAEQLLLVCDLHDTLTLAADHARLDLAGEVLELDLCAEHLAELRRLLERLLPADRRRESRQRRPNRRGGRGATGNGRAAGNRRGAGARGGGRPAADQDLTAPEKAAVREWARAHGVAVSARGRLSREVVRQYQEAQDGTAGGDHGDTAEEEPSGAVDQVDGG